MIGNNKNSGKIFEKIKELWKQKEFRVGILIVAGMLIVCILQFCKII